MREVHILNLGAGVQSTALYLLIMEGRVRVQLTAAIFADTGEEPSAVYSHLAWMRAQGGPPIRVVSTGVLGEDLIKGCNSNGQRLKVGGRFASVPFFTKPKGAIRTTGMIQRQCTRDYKIDPIERAIRREILGLKPRQRIPKGVRIHQYFGISFDEQGRAERIRRNWEKRHPKSWSVHFPLIDVKATRADCQRFNLERVPHEVPRSACVFCPYHKNFEWRRIRDTDPEGWARAIEIDEAIRTPGTLANQNMRQEMYVHFSGKPLAEVDLGEADRQLSFALECEGMCGI